MELPIRKWGNSAAVLLPTAMLEQLHAKIGDSLKVDFTGRKAALQLAKPKYSLKELLAQCDPNAAVPADVAAWESMPPIGNETV